MKGHLGSLFLLFMLLISGCDRQIEESSKDFGFDFQPLEKGLFWIYKVDETLYFGENDAENSQFFYRDLIRDFYLNAENEQVFIVERSKSTNQINWIKTKEFTLLRKGFSLIKTQDNQAIISLVFPPELGKSWNGNGFRNDVEDEFVIDDAINSASANSASVIRVLQEESDDLITFRDNRFELYEKGKGLVEKYEEVLTYCSRNDCLGDQLIDSGKKVKMEMIEYGKK